MAGIRRRSRPRDRSVNLRRFTYVLVREAAVRIFFPTGVETANVKSYRALLMRSSHGRIVEQANDMLRIHPERRYWPPARP